MMISNNALEKMSRSEKISYYKLLKDYCNKQSNLSITASQKLLSNFSKNGRKYSYEFVGIENIPSDGCILMCNHSNSHDVLNAYEILTTHNFKASVLLANDGLSPIILNIFKKANSVIVDRSSKESTRNSVFEMSNKVMNGAVGVIFGEGTWNLHPILPMHDIKVGGAKIAAITEKPIVPTILEYVEVPNICNDESKLYTKCIVTFGTPIYIDREESLIKQTADLQDIMTSMRLQNWEKLGIKRNKIEDVNKIIYINHTWLKEYGPLGINYDTERESKYLFSKTGKVVENEYCIDEYGNFVPGELKRKMKIKGF